MRQYFSVYHSTAASWLDKIYTCPLYLYQFISSIRYKISTGPLGLIFLALLFGLFTTFISLVIRAMSYLMENSSSLLISKTSKIYFLVQNINISAIIFTLLSILSGCRYPAATHWLSPYILTLRLIVLYYSRYPLI